MIDTELGKTRAFFGRPMDPSTNDELMCLNATQFFLADNMANKIFESIQSHHQIAESLAMSCNFVRSYQWVMTVNTTRCMALQG